MSDLIRRGRKATHKIVRGVKQEDAIVALLGRVAGSPQFVVTGKADWLYVRIKLSNGASTTAVARNDAGVPHILNLKVLLEREDYLGGTFVYVITGISRRSDAAYSHPSSPSGIPPHTHDDRYFRETEHIATSAGAADAGKPTKLGSDGKFDLSLYVSKLVSTALTWLANVTIASVATTGSALKVIRDLAAASTDAPVVDLIQEHASDDQPLLRGQQDGTGSIVELYDGATLVLRLNDGGELELRRASNGALLDLGDYTLTEAGTVLNQGFYRISANAVIFTSIQVGATSTMFGGGVVGDTFRRVVMDVSGNIIWGDGTALRDTNLYRPAANQLKTDDTFLVGTHLGIGTDFPTIDIVGTYDYTATPVLQVDGSTPRVLIRGSASAALDLIDTGGAANEKWIELILDAGVFKFRTLSDVAAVQVDNIFVIDMTDGRIGIGTGTPGAPIHTILSDAVTNAIGNVEILGHISSGTPAAGFGLGLIAQLESSTTANQDAGRLTWEWLTATHASRASKGKLSAYLIGSEVICIVWDSAGLVQIPGTLNAVGAVDFDSTLNVDGAVTLNAGETVTQPTLGQPVQTLIGTATNDDVKEQVIPNKVTTTDATPTTLHTFAIPVSNTVVIECTVLARRTGGTAGTADDGAAYKLVSAYTTKAGVVTLMTGGAMENIAREDVAGYNCALVISGSNVILQVTGVLDTNISWEMVARFYQIGT